MSFQDETDDLTDSLIEESRQHSGVAGIVIEVRRRMMIYENKAAASEEWGATIIADCYRLVAAELGAIANRLEHIPAGLCKK